MDNAKEKIPKNFRIPDTWFMSLETVGGYLFTRHSNNPNHVQKDSNNTLSVIIILGKHFHGGKTGFYIE